MFFNYVRFCLFYIWIVSVVGVMFLDMVFFFKYEYFVLVFLSLCKIYLFWSLIIFEFLYFMRKDELCWVVLFVNFFVNVKFIDL